MDEIENTELVDVSEVRETFKEEAEEPSKGEVQEEVFLERRSSVSSLKDRLAAFIVDTTIFVYAYFVIGTICRRVFFGSWDGPIPTYGWQGLAFHGIFAFLYFMYYFVFESVFYATPGKFLCWMYVRKKNGDFASMMSVFVRNLFRVFDYALPFIPFFMMELTKKRQRLGDFIAGTIVIRKQFTGNIHYGVTGTNIASASGRVLSAAIDLGIVGILTTGYVLLWSPEYPTLSKWLLIFTPLVPFLYFVITEPLIDTTPGKWIFGYVISHEDGTPVSFSSSVIRTVLRFFETNFIGLLAIWISQKKQRLGDLASDTIITRQRRSWYGGVALLVWLVVAILVFSVGKQNKANILTSEFRFNFMPTIEFMGGVAEESEYKELTLTHVRFAAGDVNTIRTPSVFAAGETVFIITDVYGYEKSGRMVWLQEDLDIRYPDAAIGLHQENIVDFHQVVQIRGGPVELTNSLKLPESAQDGTYIVTITVRDLFGHEQKIIKETFVVRNPQPATQAPTEPIPPQPAELVVQPKMPSEQPTQAPQPQLPPLSSPPPPSINVVPPSSQLPQESNTIPIPRSPSL